MLVSSQVSLGEKFVSLRRLFKHADIFVWVLYYVYVPYGDADEFNFGSKGAVSKPDVFT